ncbi:MAG: hypothetical protein EBV45_05240 [Chloroflexi bacterium]|nr:hypothetical protein [Chloroflexota bacterium]
MAGVSSYLEGAILNQVVGGSSYTPAATLYIGLWNTTLSDVSTGLTAGEVAGGGYSRVAVSNDSTHWPAASSGSKSNALSITFPYATSSWGTVRTVAILDASTGGNILFFSTPSPVVSVAQYDTLVFAPGDLTLSLS